MNNPVPSGMVTTTGSMSMLIFSPLAVSNAGTYTMHFSVSLTEILAVIVERASGSSPVEATKFLIRVKTIASIKALILME